jgi:hypothetical protein
MVVLQVGLSMVLLTGAGLFGRSLIKLQNEDVGFDRDNLVLLNIDPRLAGYKPPELNALYQQLLDRVSSVPQVRSVSMATYAPLSGTFRNSSIQVPGYTPQDGEDTSVEDILTGPKYAEAMGVPLLRGREIDARDTPTSTRVAVINSAFAEYFFKDQNPIGKSISFDDASADEARLEVIGVVSDMKLGDAREKATPFPLPSEALFPLPPELPLPLPE